MTTPNQTPISTNSNGDLKTSNSNDENKMSNFCLIPLPEGRPKIPLRIGQTEVGRKMLTEQLQITSQTHPKKMSVSRHQVTLTVTSDKVVLVSIGLNAINLIMKGETLAPEKNKNYTLSIGDSFTLCGQHFPFQLVTMDDSIPVPRPPEIKEEKKSKVATGVLAIPVKGMPPASNNNNNNNNNNLRSSDERPSEYWTTPSTVPSIPPNMAGVIPDYGYQYWNYYPYYPYYYPQLSQHTQMNRTPQQTYEDWKKRQLLEKKVKAEPKKKKAKEELVLRRSASIGYIVETYRKDKGHKMMGTITNYSEARRMYEITFGDRVVVWEAEQNLAVKSLPKKKEQKKKRVSSSSEEESELSDESSSESDSDDSGVDKKKKKRRSSQRLSNRQKKSTATYFEWPSDSSSDDDGDNFSAPSKSNSGNVKKRKQKKTNWSAIEKALTVTGKKTAILYSDICLKHYVPNWHLERPSRVSQIMECVKTLKNHYPNHLEIVTDISPADRKLLTAVHDEQYIAKMENQSPDNDTPRPATQFSLDDRGPEDCDTFMSHFSFDAAKTAAGAVCKAIDLVVDGKYRNAFCCIRPPGHHCGFKGHTAEAASQGYCIINNVAIGGFYAVKTHNFKRIAVVDFDVHHGNGTEEILQNNDRFLFVSIHVGEIYPGTGHEQASRASNVLNISLEPGDGSEVFRKAFDSQIMTRLESYKPELILLSSGFDGHKRDPTDDGLRLEEADYSYITDKMMEFADRTCKGRIVSVLEGGYHLPSLRKSVKEHLISLMKKVPSEPTKSTVTTTQTSVTTASSILQSPAIQEFLKTSNIQSATLTLTSTTTTVSESVTQTVAASKPPVVDLIS